MHIKNALYAPETEGGTPEPAAPATPQVPMNERPADGPGSGRSDIRRSLEKGFEDTRKATEKAEKAERARDETGKFAPRDGKQPVLNNMEEPEAAEQVVEGQTDVLPTETPPAEPVPEGIAAAAPPEAWSKEAKAEWQKLPPVIQQAVAKREADSAKGVEELKKRYAPLDQVLKPREALLRQTGHDPATAVNQLFSWFEALNMDSTRVRQGQPPVAFTALAQSFGLDPYKLFGGQPQQSQPEPAKAETPEQPVGDLPPAVQQYINGLEQKLANMEQAVTQKFGVLENTFAEQSYAKTNDILSQWSKDKPHFEEVRGMMAHMIGSGAVPPQPNGSADLDKAYDMALYALPEVRAKVLAEADAKRQAELKAKQDRERKAQQEQADKARRANVSLSNSAPGGSNASGTPKRTGKSVKESIRQTIEELSE